MNVVQEHSPTTLLPAIVRKIRRNLSANQLGVDIFGENREPSPDFTCQPTVGANLSYAFCEFNFAIREIQYR